MQASPVVIDLNTPPSTPKDVEGDEEVRVNASEDDEMRPTREHSAPSDGVEEVQPPKKQRVGDVMLVESELPSPIDMSSVSTYLCHTCRSAKTLH